MSVGKPASCLVRFSCQCRSNMIVDYALLAGSHYKMNMPCPSGPAGYLSVRAGGGGAVSGVQRAGRVAVRGADWGRYTVRCCCINLSLKGRVHPKTRRFTCAAPLMMWQRRRCILHTQAAVSPSWRSPHQDLRCRSGDTCPLTVISKWNDWICLLTDFIEVI